MASAQLGDRCPQEACRPRRTHGVLTMPAARRAAARRLWIVIGEIIGVLAVVVSALALWNSYSERRDSDSRRAADAERAGANAGTLALTAKVEDGGKWLALTALSDAQT